MPLTLHYHPLSSFCHKVLMALYENATPFTPHLVDLGDPASRAAFLALWPIGKFPVLHDQTRGETVPESSIIIEYLMRHYPGRSALIPDDAAAACRMRLADRFFDLHVNVPMQKIVTDRLRPEGQADAYGVADAKTRLAAALDLVERDMAERTWAIGDVFTMADCAAAPALFYADKAVPFGGTRPHTAAYLARLAARPSYARVLDEVKPYLSMFPQ